MDINKLKKAELEELAAANGIDITAAKTVEELRGIISQKLTESDETDNPDREADWPTIYIPRIDKEDTQRLISVNFVDYLVQTNKNVKVPPEVAEVYNNSISEAQFRDEQEEKSII